MKTTECEVWRDWNVENGVAMIIAVMIIWASIISLGLIIVVGKLRDVWYN